MSIDLDLEDTFGDIVRKASKGRAVSAQRLAEAAGISQGRLQSLLADSEKPDDGEARAIARAFGLDGGKLADIARGRWRPPAVDIGAHLDTQINTPHSSNGYFVILKEAKVAALIDPGGNARNIVTTVQRSPVALQYILLTHKHPDHVDALSDVRKAFPQAHVVVHRLDAPAIGPDVRDAIAIVDGDALPFADGEIRLLHTPGHTDGSCCFLFKGALFSGDTLFAGSVGGVFGERFGYEDLLQGIDGKLFALPRDTIVLPGHGPPSTIEGERAHNPFFA
ncbi:MAG: MBL fold metallo-hydrolase [Candidatus Eremiobacteraeota bacterium]|nr:MBL fold metallo-hydrolase [Candidatus Eremiobacteraeota bacterium]MBC5826726.1 MBL fold metallo-hydrolase [Candidatus Eremiobacteraeota bacterium]